LEGVNEMASDVSEGVSERIFGVASVVVLGEWLPSASAGLVRPVKPRIKANEVTTTANFEWRMNSLRKYDSNAFEF